MKNINDNNSLKQLVANEAIKYVPNDSIIGVGTGSTVSYFIENLASIKHKIRGAIASSIDTENKLKHCGIPLYDLNNVDEVPVYIDGADEIDNNFYMVKGGGGALTREKIIASVAKKFVCIVDSSKQVNVLGKFPLPIEVIPMARSYVAREIVKLGGMPIYRNDFVTDNNNVILDVWNLDILNSIALEEILNNITGVVTNGLFAKRSADIVLMGKNENNSLTVEVMQKNK